MFSGFSIVSVDESLWKIILLKIKMKKKTGGTWRLRAARHSSTGMAWSGRSAVDCWRWWTKSPKNWWKVMTYSRHHRWRSPTEGRYRDEQFWKVNAGLGDPELSPRRRRRYRAGGQALNGNLSCALWNRWPEVTANWFSYRLARGFPAIAWADESAESCRITCRKSRQIFACWLRGGRSWSGTAISAGENEVLKRHSLASWTGKPEPVVRKDQSDPDGRTCWWSQFAAHRFRRRWSASANWFSGMAAEWRCRLEQSGIGAAVVNVVVNSR